MKEIDIVTGEVKEDEKTSVVSVWYDPVKDLHPVDPLGFIDLRQAYENHNVPTTIADEVANYNGIDDPESMVNSPSDVFEAYRMNDAIRRYDKVHNVSPDKGEAK